MSNSEKYVGINSRIPYEVIEHAIQQYLQNGQLDKELSIQHIQQFRKGENRARKVFEQLRGLMNKSEWVLDELKDSLQIDDFLQLNATERKAVVLCLFCLAYPIAYDILSVLAVGFKVEPTLNRQFILQKIGAIYGGNRAMVIGTEESIPMLIACDAIKREKIGFYAMNKKLPVTRDFIAELVIYTDIRLSGSKTILTDELNSRPWFSYFSLLTSTTFKHLIAQKEGGTGRGYLTITR